MSDAPSTTTLPRQVDPRKFAQKGISLSGRIPLKALSRLHDAVQGGAEEIDVHLNFGVDEQGAKTLKGNADARVSVVCQRCLQPTQLDLHANIALAVVWTEAQAQNLSKDLEPWILDEGPADLYDAVEEELLLALPMVAYHEEQCVDPSVLSVGEVEPDTQESDNPFKVLEQLKGSPK
ncbi:YceD family protein [Simiduia sp. 21SJ11W-1]|uniref:YceD family protein n=1 Tax=Simiduia sp. 21SJ11W-1 TaxID=2909669 RepID=UPI00209EB3DE|nr:YceD family protein [Simiduia sp. 21SJ11W-1]UTA46346.1 YceD family protein [Simiduia sp. 21SJ11W-1]